MAALLQGCRAAGPGRGPALCQGLRPRAQPRHAGAPGQGPGQGAQSRRLDGTHGQGRRAERRHPHGRGGLRRRAVAGARHDRRHAAPQRRHRQGRQECHALERDAARWLRGAADARPAHARGADGIAGLRCGRRRDAGARQGHLIDVRSPALRKRPMPFDPHKLLNWRFPEVEHTYGEKDTMLYALGLGCGADPGATSDLKYVYERGLVALPTMAVVLASPGNWLESEESTADYSKVLHGEQYLSVHRPIPAAGTVIGRTRVKELLDKGKDKGAVLFVERQILDKARGEAIATMTSAAMLDRKSTRLNSSHLGISYAVFCLKKKTQQL